MDGRTDRQTDRQGTALSCFRDCSLQNDARFFVRGIPAFTLRQNEIHISFRNITRHRMNLIIYFVVNTFHATNEINHLEWLWLITLPV